jgi:hypothetical protein
VHRPKQDRAGPRAGWGLGRSLRARRARLLRAYGRFGFGADAARGYASPYAGEHFMALPLGPEPLSGLGAVIHPAPFAALG